MRGGVGARPRSAALAPHRATATSSESPVRNGSSTSYRICSGPRLRRPACASAGLVVIPNHSTTQNASSASFESGTSPSSRHVRNLSLGGDWPSHAWNSQPFWLGLTTVTVHSSCSGVTPRRSTSSSGTSPSHGSISTPPGSSSSSAFETAEKKERSCPPPLRACASLCASLRVSRSCAHAVLSAARVPCSSSAPTPPSLSSSSSASVSTSIEMCSAELSNGVPEMNGSANSAANAGCSQTGGGLA